MTLRRWTASLLLLLLTLAPAGCGPTSGAAAGEDGGEDGGDSAGMTVPTCPFSAAQVSEIVGQPLTDEGNCLFGDGKGVASLTITMASEAAGEMTYDYQHDQAAKTYDGVTDLAPGKGYIAIKDIAAEAVVIGDSGAYTLTLSSFGFDTSTYDRIMRALIVEIRG